MTSVTGAADGSGTDGAGTEGVAAGTDGAAAAGVGARGADARGADARGADADGADTGRADAGRADAGGADAGGADAGGADAGGAGGVCSATSVRRHGRETKRARSRPVSGTPVALSIISSVMMPAYATRQASRRTREIASASSAEPYRTCATAPA